MVRILSLWLIFCKYLILKLLCFWKIFFIIDFRLFSKSRKKLDIVVDLMGEVYDF